MKLDNEWIHSFINSVRTYALNTYVQNFCDVDNETEHMQEAWMTESSLLLLECPGQRKTIPGEGVGNSWGGRDLQLSQFILWITRPSHQLHQESGDGLRSSAGGGVTYPQQELPQFVLASKELMVTGTTVQEKTDA